jgi:hypothetical protein
MGLFFLRSAFFCLLMTSACLAARADDILFFGNSFTYGEGSPEVKKNGGVPKLVEAIAMAKGKQVATTAIIAGGKDWSYHLAQPGTDKALNSKPWNWVVLQDYSTRPTSAGNIAQFMKDGETFSDRIAAASPKAGIILYQTWARPAGAFYQTKPGLDLVNPEKMMSELHKSYADLAADLTAKNPNRPARVAPVGTAFAYVKTIYPEIVVDAKDQHHSTTDGYYLAALVIYETIYHDTAKGAPDQLYDGTLKIAPDVAAKLQETADKVCNWAG